MNHKIFHPAVLVEEVEEQWSLTMAIALVLKYPNAFFNQIEPKSLKITTVYFLYLRYFLELLFVLDKCS